MKKKVILIILLLLVISLPLLHSLFFKDKKEEKTNEKEQIQEKKEKPKLKIVDEESKSRPYAIMINNNRAAWPNHAGIQDAYLVYEMITEGGITRMMALFKDQNTERIGSVRSSRHYFLDYVLENDAIYVHFGWSPKAQSDIKTLGINNINGIYDNSFWRDRTLGVAYEHTAYTSIEMLKSLAEKRNYIRDTNKDLLFHYSISEMMIQESENAIVATTVTIPYSKSHVTSYQYDPITKTYLRFMNQIPHLDGVSNKQYFAKNIVIQKVNNYSIDSYGRQDLENIGSGDGYYITNGYAVPIVWSKKTRSSQTEYRYLDGKEITLNDGNTFIQIQPISMDSTFTE